MRLLRDAVLDHRVPDEVGDDLRAGGGGVHVVGLDVVRQVPHEGRYGIDENAVRAGCIAAARGVGGRRLEIGRWRVPSSELPKMAKRLDPFDFRWEGDAARARARARPSNG